MLSNKVSYYRCQELLFTVEALIDAQRMIFTHDQTTHIIDFSEREVLLKCQGKYRSLSFFSLDNPSYQRVDTEFGLVTLEVQCLEIRVNEQELYVRYLQDTEEVEIHLRRENEDY